jgi:geranylgeranylglycerol-phosphate geranylgeranyltransferase
MKSDTIIKDVNKYEFPILKRPLTFLSNWRSLPFYELISYVFMFLGISLLSLGSFPNTFSEYFIVLATLISLYSGFFAALIWNDITDVDIDEIVHPDRPLPSFRISSKKFFIIALFFSTMCFLFSYLVNLIFFITIILLALFVSIHNKYLKSSVPLPAYSEIVTPIQWGMVPVLGFLSFQRIDLPEILIFVLFTYFAVSSQDIIAGIHDYKGDKKKGVKTYMISFGYSKASTISFIWLIISGLFGLMIYVYSMVSLLFLLLFIPLWLFTLMKCRELFHLNEEDLKKKIVYINRKGYNYFLFTYDLIFLDLILQFFLIT